MRKDTIDINKLKDLVDSGKSYKEISLIMGFTKSSLCRCYTKNFGIKKDRAISYRQKLIITSVQKEIIFGSLLGDMCLVQHVKNIRGSECHSIKQEEYIAYKHSLLSGLCGKLIDTTTTIDGKVYKKKQFTIRPNLNLWEFYNMFYFGENHKKRIPFNLNMLTPRAIAFWFMDDGFLIKSKNSQELGFSTCCFTLEDLLRLQQFLDHTYKIKTIIRKNFYLIVRVNSCKLLADLIKPYMIESMYYKLGKYLN